MQTLIDLNVLSVFSTVILSHHRHPFYEPYNIFYMKKLVCYFAILLFTRSFSQSSFFHTSALKSRLLEEERAQKKQAALLSLKDSTYYSNWNVNSMQWANPSRIVYSYNAAGKENGLINAIIASGAWQNNYRMVNYSFDTNDNLLGYELQSWNSGWVSNQKYTYTYDNANNRLTELRQFWLPSANSWKNSTYVTNTYDSNHNLLTSIEQQWSLSASLWLNLKRETATYNTSNEYTSDVHESWNTVTSSWENFERYLFFYTNGDVTGLVEELYDSNTSTYMAIYKVAYSYDGNHHVVGSTAQKPNPTTMTWENEERETYTYDIHGNQITYLAEGWNSGTSAWENSSRQFDYYSYKTVGLNMTAAQTGQISLYPNPATDNISVLNETGTEFTSLSIMDINGKRLSEQTLDHITTLRIPVNTLPQGMYLLELKSENGPVYKKFMKN